MRESAYFDSFFLGGFESACHINRDGMRVDMIASTCHDRYVNEDYAKARELGMRTVRDAVRWHLVDQGGTYDLSSFLPMLRASSAQDLSVIWTLCHYGWPDDLDIFSGKFIDRFVRYAKCIASVLVDHGIDSPFIIPFNEISYLCHAICSEGDMYPHAVGRSCELKRQVVRATIEATDAIRSIAPSARFIQVDPIINVVPPVDRPEYTEEANSATQSQVEAAFMLAGRLAPELGGKEEYLDLVGVNYYHSNQWEHPGNKTLPWHEHPRDPRWMPLSAMLERSQRTYRRPIFIGETSHVGEGRVEWLRETVGEISLAISNGVDIQGICLFPLIDRHCWVDTDHWHNSGLWDIDYQNGHERRICADYYAAFLELSGADSRQTRLGTESSVYQPHSS